MQKRSLYYYGVYIQNPYWSCVREFCGSYAAIMYRDDGFGITFYCGRKLRLEEDRRQNRGDETGSFSVQCLYMNYVNNFHEVGKTTTISSR